jgi:hypothetical protein
LRSPQNLKKYLIFKKKYLATSKQSGRFFSNVCGLLRIFKL